ncbi:MAG: DNA (cytosine-5-)-methyltransferase [Actinobacteria bacterium]|nr:MAG: DNA (cytosine-5-)-methyltransferase [Actinomycetota bacterium]
MRFVSLFAGIGGLDLGLERAGMECVAQVEIDPFCRAVLAKHWPDVPRFEDVRDDPRGWPASDMLVGGFPCQDVSNAGRRAGISAARSGLYRQVVRALRVVRPPYALLENVAALLGRGMGRVLGDLAASGYDTEWDCLSACAVGAPHHRDRVFILAHPPRGDVPRLRLHSQPGYQAPASQSVQWVSDGRSVRVIDGQGNRRVRRIPDERVCRVVDGIPADVDRLRGLGNAVVPQVAEVIGRAIMAGGGA